MRSSDMEIHARLKLLRLLCGMTQEALAFQAEVPRPSLGHYERGSYIPSDKILGRLASSLGVEPGYIRFGSPVIESQAWLPVIPIHTRRKRETIKDILKLLPEFITENRFDNALSQLIGDDERLFFFGRNKNYTCLLLATADLAKLALSEIQNALPIIEMTMDEGLTIQKFSAKDVDHYAKNSNFLGRTFDVEGVCNSLATRRCTGALKEIKKEPLSYIFISLLKISREYDLSRDIIYALTDFLEKKYEEVAPLPIRLIRPNDLMNDIRMKIEELGGERRGQN
jgi:transcriptional regulator with XRE-family HTH domain